MLKKLSLLAILLIVCGCSQSNDKYSNFEKFNLKDRDSVFYEYHRTGNEVDKYALADISKDRYGSNPEGFLTGFFYQTDNEEYVLLDEIESCGVEDAHKYENYNQFYGNELYFVRCTGGLLLQYSFDKEKIEKRELHLDTTKIINEIDDTIDIHYIEKITENYIYFRGSSHQKAEKQFIIECSKENLECTLT